MGFDILEIIIGVVLCIFIIGAALLEFKNRNKKTDLFTDIVISVIGIGCSAYMIYDSYKGSIKNGVFNFNALLAKPNFWIYIVLILLTLAFTVIYLMFYFKNKDLPDQVEEEEEELEDEEEVLSDEEIEEILEKENAASNEEEIDIEEEAEEDEQIVLESLTAQKPKVLKPNEEDFKYKEGASQIPKTQRNPFEKK